MLTNEAGEVTSHIQGMFNRTIKMMSSGIKPVYVFDGKPPQMKGGELAKRLAKRAKAEADLAIAKEAEAVEDMDKFSKRLVKVTKEHNNDCKQLLRLMGVPVVEAPCEAEAQCAELAKKHKVYATATEDMDALTFHSTRLIRKLTFSQNSKEKQPILEIDFALVLSGMGLTYEQFVDLCILCGCDYCSTIKGIGPKTSLKLIKQHGSLEKVLDALKKEKKWDIPADWFPQRVRKVKPGEEDKIEEEEEVEDSTEEVVVKEGNEGREEDGDETKTEEESKEELEAIVAAVEEGNGEDYEIVPPLYMQARSLFIQCEVLPGENVELRWTEPDEEGLRAFLVDRMGFSAERVTSGIKRLKDAQQQKAQKRMDR